MAKKTLKILDRPNDVRAKYDWQSMRREFIEGVDDGNGTIIYPTLKQIAAKYNAPHDQVENRSGREKWGQHRTAEQNRTAIERQKLLAKTLAKKQVKFSEVAAQDAMQTQVALGKRIKQLSDLIELDTARVGALMERLENGESVTPAFRGELKGLVSSSEWESLWKAYALANEVGRKALGMKDEDGPATTIEVTQINNVTPTQTLKELDRANLLLAAMSNENMVIPELDKLRQQAAIEAPIEDAEVVEDDESDS